MEDYDFLDCSPYDGYLFTLIYLQQVTGTPFLKACYFDVCVVCNGSKEALDLYKVLYDDALLYDQSRIIEAASRFNVYCQILLDQGTVQIKKVRKGIVSPCNKAANFHGILQAQNDSPVHLFMTPFRSGNGFSVNFAGQAGRFNSQRFWKLCPQSWNVEKLVASFGEEIA